MQAASVKDKQPNIQDSYLASVLSAYFLLESWL